MPITQPSLCCVAPIMKANSVKAPYRPNVIESRSLAKTCSASMPIATATTAPATNRSTLNGNGYGSIGDKDGSPNVSVAEARAACEATALAVGFLAARRLLRLDADKAP